ncbi:MAG: HAD-IA family hydrolase [Pirellulales bacterium]|nr:HAD-IA family hydrolase [Pirellulales bacterium]
MTVAIPPSLPHDLVTGVDTVVFDVVGTLLEPAPSVSEAYKNSSEKFGVTLSSSEISKRFSVAWEKQESLDAQNTPAFSTSRSREYERWQQIVCDVFEDSLAADKIFEDLWIHFGKSSSWRPVEQGCRLLETVRESGIDVAVASNFDERLLPLAKHIEPLIRIEKIFASSELGWRKPAPQFFQAVESRLQKEPDQLLLVGDDPRLDIAAANAAGWKSMRIG